MTTSTKTVIVLRHAAGPALCFARGGLATLAAAETVRRAGRRGDSMLVHVNPSEMRELRRRWGEPSINPYTGLPEYGFMKKAWHKVKHTFHKAVGVVKKVLKSPIFQAILPIALNFIVPGLGVAIGGALGATGTAAAVVGNAALGAAIGGATGGAKGALAGALTSGVGAGVGKAGFAAKTLSNAVAGGVGSKIRGGKFATGALTAGALSAAGSAMQNAGGAEATPGAPATTPDGIKLDQPQIDANQFAPKSLTMADNITSGLNDGVTADMDSASQGGSQVEAYNETDPGAEPADTTVDGAASPKDYSGYGQQGYIPAYTPDGIAIDQPQFDMDSLQPGNPEYKIPSYFDQLKTNVMTNAKEHPLKTGMGALTMINAVTPKKQPKPPGQGGGGEYGDPTTLPPVNFNRQQTLPSVQGSYYSYGSTPEQVWFQGNQVPQSEEDQREEQQVYGASSGYARGGEIDEPTGGGALSSLTPRAVRGAGAGRDDLIDAKLSDGEYVVDAETVALLGDGSSKAGAAKLDEFRQNVRKHKGRALSKGKFSPKAKSPLAYLQARSNKARQVGAR